jgi:hypothetical protein
MTLDELKSEFKRLSREDKRQFMEDIGIEVCQDLMSDQAFTQRMMPLCMGMMDHMPAMVRHRMQEMMGPRSSGR